MINEKEYKLWEEFVQNKKSWVGGTLQDFGDETDWYLAFAEVALVTKIKEITLKPNGTDSSFFEVVGEDFTCGFDISAGGLTDGEPEWLTFEGYMGHKFRIQKPKNEN